MLWGGLGSGQPSYHWKKGTLLALVSFMKEPSHPATKKSTTGLPKG